MKRSIVLKEPQITLLQKGALNAFIIPVSPQPILKQGVGKWIKNSLIESYGDSFVVLNFVEANGPYKVGQIIYVKETWVNVGHNNCQDGKEDYNTPVYKASENGKAWDNNMEGWRWKPAIHMTEDYARFHVQITACEALRVQDICSERASLLGLRQFTKDNKTIKWGIEDIWKWQDFENDYRKALSKLISTSLSKEFWEDNYYVYLYEFKIHLNS